MYLCAQITSPLQHPPSLGNFVLFFGHKKQRFMRMTTIIARIAKILGQQYLKFNIPLVISHPPPIFWQKFWGV